jgi:hypothetical protein
MEEAALAFVRRRGDSVEMEAELHAHHLASGALYAGYDHIRRTGTAG